MTEHPIHALERAATAVPAPQDIASGEGVKHDAGKLPLHLVPFDAVEAVAHTLAFGAEKYAPRNWEKGMHWSRLFAGLMRHTWAWFRGQDKDPETGYSHLWHAGFCVLALIASELRGIGTDDRPLTEVGKDEAQRS